MAWVQTFESTHSNEMTDCIMTWNSGFLPEKADDQTSTTETND